MNAEFDTELSVYQWDDVTEDYLIVPPIQTATRKCGDSNEYGRVVDIDLDEGRFLIVVQGTLWQSGRFKLGLTCPQTTSFVNVSVVNVLHIKIHAFVCVCM